MDKLKTILKSPNDKLIAIDMDGCICHGEFWGEGFPEPDEQFIDFIRELYIKGAHIIIYTARHPGHYAKTHGWLIYHQVPFHGIAMQMKPGADLYLDDKALNLEDIKELYAIT